MKAKISFKEFVSVIFFYVIFVIFLDLFVDILVRKTVLGSIFSGLDLFLFYSVLITVGILVFYKGITKKKYSDLGIKKIKKEDISLAVKIFLMLFPVAFISRILDPSFDKYFSVAYGLGGLSSFIIFILYLPFFAIKEEIFERSFFQSLFSRGYGSLIAPILVAINFSLAHYYNTGVLSHTLNIVLSVLVGTYLIALLYEKTKNLFITIITHLVYNIFIMFQIYMHVFGLNILEIVFWTVWGILFIFFLKRTIKEIKVLFVNQVKDLGLLDLAYIIGFGVIIPVLIIYLF